MQLTPVEPLEERWWCEKSEGRHQQRRETDPAGLVRAARVLLGDVHAGVDRGTHGWCPSRSRGWLSGPSRVGDHHPIAVSRLPAERSEPAPGRWLLRCPARKACSTNRSAVSRRTREI